MDIRENTIHLSEKLTISKIGGKYLTASENVLVDKQILLGQQHTREAVYENYQTFKLLRGHGYQSKHCAIVPEIFCIFDVERCQIDLGELQQNYKQACQDSKYERIGNACSNFLLQVITGKSCNRGLSTQTAAYTAGEHIVTKMGDDCVRKAYISCAPVINVPPRIMAERAKKLAIRLVEDSACENINIALTGG